MPEISDEELAEYQHLKGIYTREVIQKSLNSITRLEDDIDAPIKKCVAAFALLGCRPLWSCCGFDYEGQPVHKKHQTGRCYFILDSKESYGILMTLFLSNMPYKQFWEMSFRGDTVDLHLDFKNVIGQWEDKNCIHYSEQAALYIGYLEKWLMGFRDGFKDIVSIGDSNKIQSSVSPYWQYPPKEDWVITKEDLLK